jgi:hypothetical protein
MTRLNSSSSNDFAVNPADARAADAKMVWSYSWEFDWSPAAPAATALRNPAGRDGVDELGSLLDKALAYAG